MELAQLRTHIRQRQHALVVGPVGIGKSALLRAAVKGRRRVLMIPRLQPLKPALLSCAQQLHAQGRLNLPDLDSAYLEWGELKPKLTSFATEDLLARLTPLLAGMIVVVDDVDGITPALARVVEGLFEVTFLVGAITTLELEPQLARFFWHFRLIVLEPLSHEASRALLWRQVDRALIPDAEVFEQHVLDSACGNPPSRFENSPARPSACR
jgi:hypothetical protein